MIRYVTSGTFAVFIFYDRCQWIGARLSRYLMVEFCVVCTAKMFNLGILICTVYMCTIARSLGDDLPAVIWISKYEMFANELAIRSSERAPPFLPVSHIIASLYHHTLYI